MEKTRERVGRYIGRLGDLGLGNLNGIPSRYAAYSDEALQEEAEKMVDQLVEPTDLSALACIDGRETLHNADESAPEVRLRRVGGSASNAGVALNAEASIVDTLSSEDDLGKQIDVIDRHVAQQTGFEKSAHLGGCGGANGEVDDDKLIHGDTLTADEHELIQKNPVILEATRTFLEIPEVKKYFSEGHEEELRELGKTELYDETLAERVRENAGKTAAFFRESGWDGQKYVDTVKKENPRGVEDLKVDHDDTTFHGHKEASLVVIIGDKTIDWPDDFAWNLKASKMVAEALAGQRGIEGYKQALIAEVAKHMAVSKRLPSDKTPIFLLEA
ncbi:MAG TPA: hypothetical protein VFH06_04715 [Candidatus Saccharimonadales bacterium]|nr:hypothetical protein [Candidatus Saccharimonadales bacterium]